MQTIYIDISNKSILPTIYAKQGDVGRKFKAVVLENGVSREITVNEHFSAGYDGASGSGNYETIGERSAFDVYGNVVTVELAPNMLQAPGLSNFCLTMNSGDGNVIGLWNIIVDVEETPGFLGDPIKDYYPGISAVLYVDQNLSKEQKEKARANIGSGTGNVKTVNGKNPDANGNVVVAGGSGIHIGTEAPTDESVSVWIDTDEEADEKYLPVKHRRFVIEYAASDLTPSDTSGVSFNASEGKQVEVLGVLTQLSYLSTISVNMSVSVPSMGEIMRLPVLLDVKNEAMGTNGSIASVSFNGIGSDSDESWVNFGAISVYKTGMMVIPANYYQAIGVMGAVITIDALYL